MTGTSNVTESIHTELLCLGGRERGGGEEGGLSANKQAAKVDEVWQPRESNNQPVDSGGL